MYQALCFMPSPVPVRPQYACVNFPVCHLFQSRVLGADGLRARTIVCASCSVNPICAFPDCFTPRAPSAGRRTLQFCATHYSDPATRRTLTWKLCTNSKVGCKQLAAQSRGGKCFACAQNHLPCLHALSGCANHCRSSGDSSARHRRACTSHDNLPCMYAPGNRAVCKTRGCPTRLSEDASAACSLCESGQVPCKHLCGRRTEMGGGDVCTLCSRPLPFATDEPMTTEHSAATSPSSIPQTSFVPMPNPSDVASASHSDRTVSVSMRDPNQLVESSICEPSDRSGAAVATCAPYPAEIASQSNPVYAVLPPGHAPKHTCVNFPLCTRLQKQIKLTSSAGTRMFVERSDFCAPCESSKASGYRCGHEGCVGVAAPKRPRKARPAFCSFHLRDPAHDRDREWVRCSHADVGCRYLSTHPGSGKCFACDNWLLRAPTYGLP